MVAAAGQVEAVLYARVSSKEQERGGFSIPAQRGLLRGYAAEHRLSVVAEFTDVETAGRAGRTAFGEMLAYMGRHPTCRTLLVEKTDRLYRNLRDWVTVDDLHVEVHLVKEGVVLSDASVSSEKFVHGIKVLMAKNYLDNLSEESRKGLLEKARQGIWPSGAPVGYINIVRADGKRVIDVDPALGPIVARVFEAYATGKHSVAKVATMALDWGLRYRKSRKPVPPGKVHAMLRTRLYMGEFEWKGRCYPGIHTPLVSRDAWDRVQDILSGRARPRRRRRRHELLFSGIVNCGRCAAEDRRFLLVGEVQKERYVYYHCEECKRRGRARYIRQEVLVQAFLEALVAGGPSAGAVVAAGNVLTGREGDCEGHDDADAAMREELRDLRARMDLAYDDRLAGRIDSGYFDQRAAGWLARIRALESALTRPESSPSATVDPTGVSHVLELAELARLMRESTDKAILRAAIRELHSNSTWGDNCLLVEWK